MRYEEIFMKKSSNFTEHNNYPVKDYKFPFSWINLRFMVVITQDAKISSCTTEVNLWKMHTYCSQFRRVQNCGITDIFTRSTVRKLVSLHYRFNVPHTCATYIEMMINHREIKSTNFSKTFCSTVAQSHCSQKNESFMAISRFLSQVPF